MTRKEKQEARAERYREYAENAQRRADEAFETSSKAVEGIPFGQPIIVGHHSESAHRNAIDRSNRAMERSVNESEKAAYYRHKAEAVENNNNIYLGDDDAIERLEEKVTKLTALQEKMKNGNKIIRSKSLSFEEKVAKLVYIGHTEEKAKEMIKDDFQWPAYALTNNNAKINAAKKQLEKAKSLAGKEDKEYQVGEITIEECYSENRIKMYFPGKPDEDMRNKLKHNGFRWAPSNGCWQAYINRWTLRFVQELTA